MTIPVLCNQCGASLDVTESTRFATCRYCQTRLAIKHSDSAAYSEVLEELRETTQGVVSDVELLKLQHLLLQIEREWEEEQARYAIRDKYGSVSYPDGGVGDLLYYLVLIGAGIVGIVFLFKVILDEGWNGEPVFFLFLVLIFLLGAGIHRYTNSTDYLQAQEAYETRREEVLRQLQKLSPENYPPDSHPEPTGYQPYRSGIPEETP